ncbi:MAG: IgGFc-binding protein [Dysgonamonadaceae bacterium]|nr:IgGFc-binding protein [Dysgonamonadaceae bacterium]
MNKNKLTHKYLLLLLFCLSFTANIFAQTDTEFWFACPALSKQHFHDCIKLQLISYGNAATVTITQPANPGFRPIVRNLTAYNYSTVELKSLVDMVATEPGDVRNTGLLITATNDIGVYYANTCDNSEIYALKGRNALGTDFLIPTQYDFDSSSGYGGSSSVEIVAIEDNTAVTITPTKNCVGHPANVPFTINLNRGQSFCLRASSIKKEDHLFNTTVVSDKPVAVNYTDDSLAGPGVDLIGDQLVPVNLLGTDYIAVSNNQGTNNDIVYIFPTQDNTQVLVDGALHATLNRGGSARIEIPNSNQIQAKHITSDKPISVLQYTRKKNEPGASILPALACTGSREISYKQTGDALRVTIVTKIENTDGFLVDGNNPYLIPQGSFTSLADGSGWAYCNREISTAPGKVLQISNKKGFFHAGFFDNPGTTCSFGFFSNYNKISLSGNTGKAYYRTGETINLVLADTASLENFLWTGPNGFTSNAFSPQIENCTQANAGMYIVTASHKDGCPIEPDTFYVHVFPEAEMQEQTICYGNNITLSAPGSEPFLWNNGETTKTITVTPTITTDYSVTSMQAGFDSLRFFALTDAYRVVVLDSLKPNISGDRFICHGNAALSVLENYESYLWSTGETTQSINVTQAGVYSVNVTDGDCRGSGIFSVNPAPQINITVNNKIAFCPDETTFELEYQSITGEIGSFDIDFENQELPDKTGEQLTNDKIIVEIPQNMRPDIYKATLSVYEKNCGEKQTVPLEIMVKYPSDIIAQRWNDILGVMNAQYNGGYNFTAFQWYRNGVEMAGETKSYIYKKDEFNFTDAYSALLTNTAGKQIFTCDFIPEHLQTGSIQTLVHPLQVINVNANGTASFYDIAGAVYHIQQVKDNKMIAPEKQGMYILKFNDKVFKIVVQ